MPRGGFRKGAGRKKSLEEETDAYRLPKSIGEKAKSGYFKELEKIIDESFEELNQHGGNTRDWTKLKRFLVKVEDLRKEHLKE